MYTDYTLNNIKSVKIQSASYNTTASDYYILENDGSGWHQVNMNHNKTTNSFEYVSQITKNYVKYAFVARGDSKKIRVPIKSFEFNTIK